MKVSRDLKAGNRKVVIISTTLLLLTLISSVGATPIAHAAIFGFGQNISSNITAQTPQQIQNQIIKLQQELAVAKQVEQQKIHQAIAAKQAAERAAIAKLIGPVVRLDENKGCSQDQHTPTTYLTYLQHFSCGHVSVYLNGTILRKFTLYVDDYNGSGKPYPITTSQIDPVFAGPINPNTWKTHFSHFRPLTYHAWTFNGTVPGPTLRVTQGDHVEVTVINTKDSQFAHSWHVHSIHSGLNDGTMTNSGLILPGTSYTYKFVANPAGVYPYHCHMTPVEEHISRGLYGMMIIDPPTPRPKAVEMVMTLNEYTFSYMGVNGSGHLQQTVVPTQQQLEKNISAVEEATDENNGPDNQVYTVNGMAFGYTGPHMINLQTGVNYRIYLENMVEFDPLNNFHLHGAMFTYTPSCTMNSSKIYTDIVALMQGDRGCLDVHFLQPGLFMFHSHLNHFSDLGWVGVFNVTNSKPTPVSIAPQVPITTTTPNLSTLSGGQLSPQEVPRNK